MSSLKTKTPIKFNSSEEKKVTKSQPPPPQATDTTVESTKSQPHTHSQALTGGRSSPLQEGKKKQNHNHLPKTTSYQKKNCNPNDLIDAFIDLTIVPHGQSHHHASNSDPQTTTTVTHQ